MTRIAHINELYGGRELLDVAQRHAARFFNTCMMHTLLGAAVSDALDDGRSSAASAASTTSSRWRMRCRVDAPR